MRSAICLTLILAAMSGVAAFGQIPTLSELAAENGDRDSRDQQADEKIRSLALTIVQAEKDSRVPRALIAAVLHDEILRRDGTDDEQDAVAREALKARGADRERIIAGVWRRHGQQVWDVSFGLAQMTPTSLRDVAENGFFWRRPRGFRAKDLWSVLGVLLNEDYAPRVVAYRLRHISEHWKTRARARRGCKVNLLAHPQGPAVLATLYSMGLTGGRGVHCNPMPNERGRVIADKMGAMAALLEPR